MHDQGVKAWPPFRLVNLGNGQIISGIRPQAEYSFGGKGNQPPFGQNLGGFFDVVLGGPQSLCVHDPIDAAF